MHTQKNQNMAGTKLQARKAWKCRFQPDSRSKTVVYSIKKAVDSIKRALSSIEKASDSIKRAYKIRSKEPHIPSIETYIPSKDFFSIQQKSTPNKNLRHLEPPHGMSKEPYMSSKEPYKSPQIKTFVILKQYRQSHPTRLLLKTGLKS